MTDEFDLRLGKVEGEVSNIRVILEGKPVWDIGKNHIIRYEGGMEAKLDNILVQLPRRWTRNQRIKVFGIAATTLVGSLSVFVWGF